MKRINNTTTAMPTAATVRRITRTRANPTMLGSANIGWSLMVIPIPYRRKTAERLQEFFIGLFSRNEA